MAAKRPDPIAYARECAPRPGGRAAWIDKHPEARDTVEKWVKEWRSGSSMTWPQAHAYMKTWHGYPASTSALKHYVEKRFGTVKT